MSMGDIFDEAFDLYKRNFALFAGIVAVVHVPAAMVLTAVELALNLDRFEGRSNSPDAVSEALGLMVVFFGILFVYFLFFIIQSGALSVAVSDRHLNRPVTLGSAYRRTFPHLLRLLVSWFLAACILGAVFIGLAFAVAIVVSLYAVAVTGSGQPSQTLSVIIVLAMFLLPMIAVVAFAVSLALFLVQVVVVEGGGYMSAFQRNWLLVKGRFWSTLGFALMLGVLTNALVLALAGSVELGLNFLVFSWLPVSSLGERIVREVVQNTIWMFLQPFWMICITLLYYDRRVRREGFDLSLLARHLETRQTGEVSA
jgi:hypothetical protein